MNENETSFFSDSFPREGMLVDGKIPTYHQVIFNVLRSEAPAKNSHFQITASHGSDLAKHIGTDPVVFLVMGINEDFPRIPVDQSEIIAQSLEPAFLTELPR